MTTPQMRPATHADLPAFDTIREAAFASVFASFREILGDSLYERVQAREDEAQADLLTSLFKPDSPWQVYAAESDGEIVGFVSLQMDRETHVGEIGLNAVDPRHAGQGIGTAMYEFAVSQMKAAGMRAATVATGADKSHAPARRAYEKAGFNRQIPSVWMCQEL